MEGVAGVDEVGWVARMVVSEDTGGVDFDVADRRFIDLVP
jgi:hypothetical protein